MNTLEKNRWIRSSIAVMAVAVLAGCSAAEPNDADASSTPEISTTPTAVETEAAQPIAVPEVSAGEIARAVFEEDGPDGVPGGEMVISDAIVAGDELVVRGQCDGDTVSYKVDSADPDTERRTLLAGTLICGEGNDPFVYTTDYSGPAQLLFTETDGSSIAWVVLEATNR